MRMMVRDNLAGFDVIDKNGEVELAKYKVGATVTVKVSDHRNLDQSALLHVWIAQIAKHLSDTPSNIKAEIKLNFAIPVLREDPQFNGFYRACLADLTYVQRRKSMSYISATSLMTKAQMASCMDHIQKVYSEQGIVLKSNKENNA